jgi:hypothetical protein
MIEPYDEQIAGTEPTLSVAGRAGKRRALPGLIAELERARVVRSRRRRLGAGALAATVCVGALLAIVSAASAPAGPRPPGVEPGVTEAAPPDAFPIRRLATDGERIEQVPGGGRATRLAVGGAERAVRRLRPPSTARPLADAELVARAAELGRDLGVVRAGGRVAIVEVNATNAGGS